MILLQDFNSNQYNLSLNQVDNIIPEIPNITVTTIPINSIKARYFFNAKKYEKALKLLDKGTYANPFLYYSEMMKSQIFEKQGKLDSAKYYAKQAFFGLPNNDLHSSRYINLIGLTNDKEAINEAFEYLTKKNKLINWKNYLIIASNLNDFKENPILIKRAKRALEIFPYDAEIKRLYNKIIIGENNLNNSLNYSNEGLKYFNNQDFTRAAIEFEKAIKSNPLNYVYFENAATANYMNGNLQKALDQINLVINEMNPLNGKCEYIKALIFIKMQDPVGACPLLKTAVDSGHVPANTTYAQYCN